jgi:hypothetical protein
MSFTSIFINNREKHEKNEKKGEKGHKCYLKETWPIKFILALVSLALIDNIIMEEK